MNTKTFASSDQMVARIFILLEIVPSAGIQSTKKRHAQSSTATDEVDYILAIDERSVWMNTGSLKADQAGI